MTGREWRRQGKGEGKGWKGGKAERRVEGKEEREREREGRGSRHKDWSAGVEVFLFRRNNAT